MDPCGFYSLSWRLKMNPSPPPQVSCQLIQSTIKILLPLISNAWRHHNRCVIRFTLLYAKHHTEFAKHRGLGLFGERLMAKKRIALELHSKWKKHSSQWSYNWVHLPLTKHSKFWSLFSSLKLLIFFKFKVYFLGFL